MAVRPLRPATDRRLGKPLPYLLANRTRTPLIAIETFPLAGSCGISPGFPELSPTTRQIIHALLTRSPLYFPTEVGFLVRLACVRHAASVDSEPGSNSQFNSLAFLLSKLTFAYFPQLSKISATVLPASVAQTLILREFMSGFKLNGKFAEIKLRSTKQSSLLIDYNAIHFPHTADY